MIYTLNVGIARNEQVSKLHSRRSVKEVCTLTHRQHKTVQVVLMNKSKVMQTIPLQDLLSHQPGFGSSTRGVTLQRAMKIITFLALGAVLCCLLHSNLSIHRQPPHGHRVAHLQRLFWSGRSTSVAADPEFLVGRCCAVAFSASVRWCDHRCAFSGPSIGIRAAARRRSSTR